MKSRALIESAVKGGVRHFIFSSTAATYGIPEQVPVAEDAPTEPINPYGWSKLMTERMLAGRRRRPSAQLSARCAISTSPAPTREGRSGQSTAGATHLIKVAVEAATGKRGHVSVYGTDYDTPDGTGVRDYIHVSDLAAAHVHALEQLIADPATSHIMNCGYGRGFSVLEVLDSVDRVTNLQDRAAAGAAPRRRSATRWSPTTAGSSPPSPGGPKRDDLDTIVADALAWERKLAERE